MSFSVFVQEFEDGLRLDKFLAKKCEINYSLAQKLIREKKVRVNGSRASDKSLRVFESDEVRVYADISARKAVVNSSRDVAESKINRFFERKIYEDENVIAIDKESGVAVQGRSSKHASIDDILYSLRQKGQNFYLVHRLDRDTSGVLLLAKNKKSAAFLSDAFKKKKITKTYLALVVGEFRDEEIDVKIPLIKKRVGELEKVYPDKVHGKEAVSRFKLLKRFRDYSLLQMMPITGRTHQLRVHAKEMGHVIVNDFKYGAKSSLMKDVSKRLCLHAFSIKIEDYFGEDLLIKSEAPDFIVGKFDINKI